MEDIIQFDYTLAVTKMTKLEELKRFDESFEVNSFKVNGNSMWLDKIVRVSLLQTSAILEQSGTDEIDLWTDFGKITLKIAVLKQLIYAIELYAKSCYDVTAQHKFNIQSLTTQEDVYAYDFKTGYPEKLSFNL